MIILGSFQEKKDVAEGWSEFTTVLDVILECIEMVLGPIQDSKIRYYLAFGV